MKKLLALRVALVMLLSVAAALADPLKVGIINSPPEESAYFETNVRDFERYFTAENGYDAVTACAADTAGQQEAARRFIADGVKYLLVSAAESAGWDSVLAEARDAGVTVILFSRMIDCDPGLYAAAVVSDYAAQGANAVAWLEYAGLEEYNVVHVQGTLGSVIQLGRSEALEAAFADGSMNKVAQQSASWNEEEAKAFVASVIQSGRKFNVIYAESDIMAKGAVAALDDAGITHGADGDVVIVSFDGSAWALRELLDGNWNYDGQCSPYQAPFVDMMIKTLDAGGDLSDFGLDDLKRIVSEEMGFVTGEITEEYVWAFGLGE